MYILLYSVAIDRERNRQKYEATEKNRKRERERQTQTYTKTKKTDRRTYSKIFKELGRESESKIKRERDEEKRGL